MSAIKPPTSKPIEDELDRMSIDQLHANVLNFSKNCFEVKKLCTTILVSASVLVATFTSGSLDHSFFVAAVIVIGFFWVLDAQSYYLQRLLRFRMKELEAEILIRNQSTKRAEGIGIELTGSPSTRALRFKSYFNESMAFYGLLAVIDLAVWLLFLTDVIGSS